jgi:hypothetical protein
MGKLQESCITTVTKSTPEISLIAKHLKLFSLCLFLLANALTLLLSGRPTKYYILIHTLYTLYNNVSKTLLTVENFKLKYPNGNRSPPDTQSAGAKMI